MKRRPNIKKYLFTLQVRLLSGEIKNLEYRTFFESNAIKSAMSKEDVDDVIAVIGKKEIPSPS